MIKLEGGFIANLGKIYGLYTLGFLAFVILMAILEQAGVGADAIGYMFVGFTIAIYALIGVLSRTMQSDEYYVAGRSVPAVFNGMATGSDWMSGASFIAMAGGIRDEGRANSIKLMRKTNQGKREIYKIDLSTIDGLKNAQMIVQSNDYIYVDFKPRFASSFLSEVTPWLSLLSTAVITYSIFRP